MTGSHYYELSRSRHQDTWNIMYGGRVVKIVTGHEFAIDEANRLNMVHGLRLVPPGGTFQGQRKTVSFDWCNVCNRWLAVNKDGMMRRHGPNIGSPFSCPGSHRPPWKRPQPLPAVPVYPQTTRTNNDMTYIQDPYGYEAANHLLAGGAIDVYEAVDGWQPVADNHVESDADFWKDDARRNIRHPGYRLAPKVTTVTVQDLLDADRKQMGDTWVERVANAHDDGEILAVQVCNTYSSDWYRVTDTVEVTIPLSSLPTISFRPVAPQRFTGTIDGTFR